MIGIFDSGVGGLSIYRELKKFALEFQVIYFADQKYIPYGDKSVEVIRDRAEKISKFLIDKGCTLIVVACNTATVGTPIKYLRETFPKVTFIGVEPPVKPLAGSSKSVKLLLATKATISSSYLQTLIIKFPDCDLQLIPAVGLADAIEAGTEVDSLLDKLLDKYTDEEDIVLGLGCTHYAFVSNQIQAILSQAHIIDVSTSVAKQIKQMYQFTPITDVKSDMFFTSRDEGIFLKKQLENLLGIDFEVESVGI